MILLEKHIELKIYHQHQLKGYNVVQLLTAKGEIFFKIFLNDHYLFTLLLIDNDSIGFELSKLDKDLDIDIDWALYAKIEASLYSVFLTEIPS